ncbi:cancer-related nucleoside-triphosphatase homolog isoform X2 [Monomorium pharaonis]|nr:cancer-related nucleoside-triphosphatase homolog isoform X2 [Monomorium pharaonis]
MGSRFDGFYTEEVRNKNGSRIGFDIVGIKDPERRLSLARRITKAQEASEYKVGTYHVFVNNFETVALPILDLNLETDILLVDEIGKMELFSRNFKKKITDIFFNSSNKAFVIGTIPQLNKVPPQHVELFEKLHSDMRIKILNVTSKNRNDLPEEIIRYL